jgi:adenylyltransferase/sulfurtransferase
LSEIGEKGQLKIRESRVLIVGAGGLGCPAALYLVAAGVGKLGLVDPDKVAYSNLQRQVLYRTDEVGELKVERARKTLLSLNPETEIVTYPFALDVSNSKEIFQEYDVILDATDNFSTRYLVNDSCFFLKKPNIFASVSRFEGRLAVFLPGGPCYRCIYPNPPEEAILNCAEEGVLGTVPGILGTFQAMEALKIILGLKDKTQTQLLVFDLLPLDFSQTRILKHPNCSLCGPSPTIRKIESIDNPCEIAPEIEVETLKNELRGSSSIALIDVRELDEFSQGTIAGAKHIPLSTLLNDGLEMASNKRSQVAARDLIKKGYSHVRSLKGGYQLWRKLTLYH